MLSGRTGLCWNMMLPGKTASRDNIAAQRRKLIKQLVDVWFTFAAQSGCGICVIFKNTGSYSLKKMV